MIKYLPFLRPVLCTIICLTLLGTHARAFSVLAHEAIVDAEWDTGIKPLLKDKFPNITGPEYKAAHAYAYGGCLMADMGYMPGGNEVFTDLLHYVRSGDFVINLINEAHTINEYAFALGALSHYMADEYGHSLATNKTVPIVFPKLKQKFGSTVTYDDDHTSHSRIEFTYDVLQIGKGTYASDAYHDFIGFNMAVPQLERAFKLTYGQDLSDYFSNINSSINMYRWGVRNFFPRLIRNAAKSHKGEIKDLNSTSTAQVFRYRMKRHMFNIEYGKERHTHNFLARTLTSLVWLLPKVGPLKKLKYIDPTPQGEKLFAESFTTIVQHYGTNLKKLGQQQLTLPDIDFDTGRHTVAGEYHLADETYNSLVVSLQENQFKYLTPELKQHIVDFYAATKPSSFAGLKSKDRKKLLVALKEVRVAQPVQIKDSTAASSSLTTGK